MPDRLILGFDTSAAHCAAALLSNGRVIGTRYEDMAKGQAERLMGLLQQMLDGEGMVWADLDAIGVGIGPGNFTGIRISVSAARGLSLSLGVPAIGVSTFEIGFEQHGALPGPGRASHLVRTPAPREQCYTMPFRHGRPAGPPAIEGPDTDGTRLQCPPVDWRAAPADICRIASRKHDEGVQERPAPLYVRAPDAAPPRDPAPVILP